MTAIYITALLSSLSASILLFMLSSSAKKPATTNDEWVERHKAKAREYAITHAPGKKVIAQKKTGNWEEGILIGGQDWKLFTFFFNVKFNDGSIEKLEESKVTLSK